LFVGNNRILEDNNVTIHRVARNATYSFECRRVNGSNTACTQQYTVRQTPPINWFVLSLSNI